MEIVLMFLLLFIVYMMIVDFKKGFFEGMGLFFIGFVVGVNVMVGGLFLGVLMNFVSLFGFVLVSGDWIDYWVYWVGLFIGGGFVGYIYENFFIVSFYVLLLGEEGF